MNDLHFHVGKTTPSLKKENILKSILSSSLLFLLSPLLMVQTRKKRERAIRAERESERKSKKICHKGRRRGERRVAEMEPNKKKGKKKGKERETRCGREEREEDRGMEWEKEGDERGMMNLFFFMQGR